MDQIKFEKYKNLKTSFLHIAIPGTDNLIDNVLKLYKKFQPECIVIHSTIRPGTTAKLQEKLPIPIIYSATRGIHKRMNRDLKRYTKFFSIYDFAPNSKWAVRTFKNKMRKCMVINRYFYAF